MKFVMLYAWPQTMPTSSLELWGGTVREYCKISPGRAGEGRKCALIPKAEELGMEMKNGYSKSGWHMYFKLTSCQNNAT